MRVRPFLLAAFLLASSQAQYAPAAPLENQAADLNLKEGLVLGDRGGVLELEARDVSLGMLLGELASKGPVQTKLTAPSLASCSVNVKYQQVGSLREVIESLLEGFSYTLHAATSGTLTLTVLSPCPPVRVTATSAVARTASALPQRAEPLEAPAPADDDGPAEGEPRSLDEFEPLTVEEPARDDDDDDEDGNAPSRETEEQESVYQDAVIGRALEVLRSSHRHLKSEAIKSLSGVLKPEVTQVLIEAASGKLDLTAEARAEAVAALWQSATRPDFPTPTVSSALKHLAEDVDPAVSSVAKGAVKDLEQRALTTR